MGDRLIERLTEAMEEPQDLGQSEVCELGRDAMREIDALRKERDALSARVEVLEGALKPLSEHWAARSAYAPEWDERDSVSIQVTIGELRIARAALEGKE